MFLVRRFAAVFNGHMEFAKKIVLVGVKHLNGSFHYV